MTEVPTEFTMSVEEAMAVRDVLADPELYVQEDDGASGWIPQELYDSVLDPLIVRLQALWQQMPKPEPRTMLVHLNIEVDPQDTRTADEVASYIDDALTVGMESHDGGETLTIVIPLAEEI